MRYSHDAEIVAHRGMRGTEHPANSLDAFIAAGSYGFGIELDVRDHRGSVVVCRLPSTSKLTVSVA